MTTPEFVPALENRRILQSVADFANSSLVKERILALKPHTKEDILQDELNKLDCLWYLLEEGTPPFHEIGNPSRHLKRLESLDAQLTPDEFLEVLRMLICFRNIKKWFTDRSNRAKAVMYVVESIHPQPELEKAITSIIDPNGYVVDNASVELKRIRKELEKLDGKLQEIMQKTLRSWSNSGYLQDQLIALRNGHYTLPVLVQYRNKVQGIIQDTSNSGNTVFVEPYEAIETTNRQLALQNAEREEILKILRELANRIQPFVNELDASLASVVLLAQWSARVHYGKVMYGVLPELSNCDELRLRNARHPLLQQRIGRDQVVPLSMDLSTENGKVLLISGPNAGGKTVALKTIGLAVTMTKYGLPVVADVAVLPFVDEVYAIIGDDQSIEQDLSTFSAHLTALEKTFHSRSPKKVVLVDEICSGTDPAEGSALAKAMLLRWLEDRCYVICTTHQSTLKLFAYETQGIANGSMAFDEEMLRPTFRFRMNVPGSSYALEIAHQVKIPSLIRQQATQFLGERTMQIEHLLEELTNRKEQAEKALREIENEKAQILQRKQQIELRDKKSESILEQARIQAVWMTEQYLQDANKRIEQAIQQLREQQASKESIHSAHDAVDLLRSELRTKVTKPKSQRNPSQAVSKKAIAESNETENFIWKEGIEVQLRDSDTIGVIVGVSEDYLQVSIGSVTIRVSYEQVIPLTTKSELPPSHHRVLAETTQSYRLDIRGYTREEAIEEIERFLADAAADGWTTLEIIHGKGTGVLRETTAEILRKNPLVKDWHLGLVGEGSGGMTVVKLK